MGTWFLTPPLVNPAERGLRPPMGVTCGSVREPGSLTLPFGVGFMVFLTSSKTGLCPFLAAQQQCPGVTQKRDCLLAGGFAANPIGVGCGGFSTSSKNLYTHTHEAKFFRTGVRHKICLCVIFLLLRSKKITHKRAFWGTQSPKPPLWEAASLLT